MQYKNYRFFLIIMLSLSVFISCQKNINAGGATTPTPTPVASANDKLEDTVLLDTRDIYLWYSQIPSTFNPRIYANPDSIMTAIHQYSIEPGFTAPVDRWSFAMRQTDWNNLSNGISGDFGINVFFFNSPSVTTDLRVKTVERESPAGKAGIKRGWRISKINGSTNIDASNTASLNAVVAAIFSSTNTSFTFVKPDGSSVDITLTAAGYQTHPVLVDSVYTISTKKIGYMVFSSFLGDTTEIYNEFNRVFNRFATAGVNDVIIDLRYNGGGYGTVAEKLSDYLAPTSVNGSLMYTEKYNDKYSMYNTSLNFKKAGVVNLSRVFFIVSSSSASASELVINNMTPVMDVKLVGKNKTYGKPVGFFPIPEGDWYIFPVSIRNTNQVGSGNYFNGFTPNSIVADGLDKDWGDVTETSLASAIKYITTGSFRLQSQPEYQELPAVTNANSILDAHSFKGTISTNKIVK